MTARVSFPTTRSRSEFAAAGPAIVHLPPNYTEASKSVLDSYYNGDKGRRHQRTLVRSSCMVADQFRNTGGGPEIGSVAVHHGLLQQKVAQAPSLLPIQLQRSTWRGAHPQPLGSTSPSGRQRITELALQPIRPPHFAERVTRIQQRQGSPAPIFDQIGAPPQSGYRCSAPERLLLHYLCRDQQYVQDDHLMGGNNGWKPASPVACDQKIGSRSWVAILNSRFAPVSKQVRSEGLQPSERTLNSLLLRATS